MTTGTTPNPVLLPLLQGGPVDPAAFPEGIEWEEPDYDPQTGELVWATHHLSAEEWNAKHEEETKQREAFLALQRAEAAKPFHFVDLDDIEAFAKRDRPCALVDAITNGRGRSLEELLDLFAGDATPAPRVKAELRTTVRHLVAELKAQRQTNLALRQRVVDLEGQLRAARSGAKAAAQRDAAGGPGRAAVA
ncbi:MAG: hypothetical protein ING29_12875 [Azospirillum sp.]|nr:hypothetical protein [Azospirillum sp.]